MKYLECWKELKTVLVNNLPSEYSVESVEFPNTPFDKPDNTNQWVRVNDVLLSQTGDRYYKRETRLLSFNLFFPKGIGTLKPYETANEFLKLFEYKSFENCWTEEGEIVKSSSPNDSWFQLNVKIKYYLEY